MNNTRRILPPSRPAGHSARPGSRASSLIHSAAAMAAVVLALSAGAARAEDSPAPSEELLVFVQNGAASGEISKSFSSRHLPDLREEAEKLDLALRVVEISGAGAPPEIRMTPVIAYQSHRGRALFQGRYADSGKVAHFVRTQRAIPPTGGTYDVEDAALLKLGKARVQAPLKITPLAGVAADSPEAEMLRAEAASVVKDGFEHFLRVPSATLGPSDRAFYMDFHPYLSDDGTLYVSTALFSQFNCIDPVYSGYDSPVSGSFEFWQEIFQRAARRLEDQVLEQIRTSELGDGFDPVPAEVATASWESLGLELPPRPAGPAVEIADVTLAEEWVIEAAPENGAPRLVFRFPPPLERYSGEVSSLTGALSLPGIPEAGEASGFIEVETASVTMGEDSLDKAVRGKMIFVDKFPNARFELERVVGSEPLAFGRSSPFIAEGTFTMMGFSIPLEVRAQLEPVIGEDGAPRLQVQAGFELRLKKPFGVAGPDGPAPANDTLQFNLDFLMVSR
ncbi:MAG: YceI family protein [Acidobacteriota bacterium]